MVVDVATAASASDSTHLESTAEAAEERDVQASEADAARLGSFRFFRSRRLAANFPVWSGPARLRMRRVRL